MFGDTFETIEDQLNPNSTTVYASKKARNCADYLELPELPRVKHFAGLKNQGATCYLNSLIQSYYMSPEFRNVVLQLPLCNNSINESANLAQNDGRNKFLLEFQKLFIQLQNLQTRATSTQQLTQSFGWNDGEQLQQQDVSEANKVLFETMDRALLGTPYKLTSYYKGAIFHHITCLNCNNSHGHEETFYDLNVHVEGNKTLSEALFALVNPFLLNEGNQYFCDICNKKVDALKGDKIRKLPPILTLTLNRYTFDYEKMARVKLNDRFEFPLEIEMGMYLENPQDNLIYELQGIIIHRGNAHGGHYHAYFRDLLDEADWNGHIAEYWNEKTQQKMTEDIDYDEVQFPNEVNNPLLTQGWYNFNDNAVIPIPVNKIQSQFQGSESAYILIYRDRSLQPQKLSPDKIPLYLLDYVNQQNTIIDKERLDYEEAKQFINIQVSDSSVVDIQNQKLISEKYDSVQYHLKLSTTVNELYKQINKEGYTLLEFVENYQTKLLHFPRYLQDSDKTLTDEQVNHDSTWILVKDTNLPQVGLEKVPYRLNLLINKKPQNYLLYTSTTLSELKELIFQLTGIPQNEQQLKNVTNQKIVSDLIDETKLGELQLTLETQILVQRKQPQQVETQKQQQQQIGDDVVSVLVEREEEHGTHRFYVNINSTVQELVDFIKEQLGMTDARRLRNLNGRQLFCKSDLTLQLKEFQDFKEGGARLQIEKGDIPENGKISLKIKFEEREEFEVHADPRTDKISTIKQEACNHYKINPNQVRLYKVDWLSVPTEGLTDEDKLIQSCYLRDRDLLIICDKGAALDCELIRFQLYQTTTGYPDDCKFQKHEALRKDATLRNLKEMIIQTFNLGIPVENLRVRDINKNRFFGQVLRRLDQQIRKFNFSTNDLVYQILDKPEDLLDDEMLLLIKQRDVMNRVYVNQQEFIFKVTKAPTIQDLKDQIAQYIGIGQEAKMEIAKFVVYEFQWLHLNIESLKQDKQKQQGKKGKEKQGKKQSKQPEIQDNLRKPPFNLSEGDFIGYRLGEFDDDDFQTQEDNELRQRMIAARKDKHSQFGNRKIAEPQFYVDIQ